MLSCSISTFVLLSLPGMAPMVGGALTWCIVGTCMALIEEAALDDWCQQAVLFVLIKQDAHSWILTTPRKSKTEATGVFRTLFNDLSGGVGVSASGDSSLCWVSKKGKERVSCRQAWPKHSRSRMALEVRRRGCHTQDCALSETWLVL